MEEQRIDISKYLKFLSKEGWSDLIDERWKEDVKKELLSINLTCCDDVCGEL